MIEPVLFMQTDARWSEIEYATGKNDKVGRSIATIGNSGCGPSCMAMVITSLTGQTVTPKDTCAWSLKNGGKATNQGTYYSYFEPQGKVYDISVKQMNWTNNYKNPSLYDLRTKVLTELHDGNWVIAVMGSSIWTTSGHVVLAWYCDDDDYVYIKDPYNTNKNCTKAHKDTFLNAAKYFWLVDVKGYMETHKKEDDEVVESRPVNVFGDDFEEDTIFKDGRNYISPHIFFNMGLDVTSEGSKPVVTMPGVKVNGKNFRGFFHNGTAFIALEDWEKENGSDVGWDEKEKNVIVKR